MARDTIEGSHPDFSDVETVSLTQPLSFELESSSLTSHSPAPTGEVHIHTSDRILFKRCRRKWDLQSQMRMGLIPLGLPAGPLWFGTGWHFAMEDYHGYNRFGDPEEALLAYTSAFRESERPGDWAELVQLGLDMIQYYRDHWLPRRQGNFRTLVLNGRPQVEVKFKIHLGTMHRPSGILSHNGSSDEVAIYYVGTFDRIVVDPHNRLWVLDYKTAKRIDTGKLETDPQVSAYAWAAAQIYQQPFEGVVWMQFLKATPRRPQELVRGGFSQAKNQSTTYSVYRAALKEVYGDKIPITYREYLNYLAQLETPEGDKFIRYDLLRRNQFHLDSEAVKISQEMVDMAQPDLPLYPNPTRDCIWECPFRQICIAMDDGSDYELLIHSTTTPPNNPQRQADEAKLESWRDRINYPKPIELLA